MADNIANHAADPLVDWQEAFAAFHPSALDSLHETIRAELGYVTATARPPTPPDDHVTSQPPDAIGLGGQAEYSQMNDMPALDFTGLDFQDISISSDAHPREIDDTITMQIVLSTDSARDFIRSIDASPGWKLLFLDVFREHWFWFATVSSTSEPSFVDIFEEALQRRSLHPGFTLQDIPIVLHSGPTQTRSDRAEFVAAFKAGISDVTKTMNNYCYARSKDLLINIPSENYNGILLSSMHPIAPEVLEYIQRAVEWDPRWGFNILHTFDIDPNGATVVNWFDNVFVKTYMRAAMDPNSRGWFGVMKFTQDLDGTNLWKAISRPNTDFASWILAWFITDLIADVLHQYTWKRGYVTPTRIKSVWEHQYKIKRLIDSVLSFGMPGQTSSEKIRAWRGLHRLLDC